MIPYTDTRNLSTSRHASESDHRTLARLASSPMQRPPPDKDCGKKTCPWPGWFQTQAAPLPVTQSAAMRALSMAAEIRLWSFSSLDD